MLWIIRQHFPFGIAELICAFAQTPEPFESLDFSYWQDVPEYVDGNYGHVPMCAVAAPAFI